MADGTIAGNRPDALPAWGELPMRELETPLRLGMGPSGSVVSGGALLTDGLAGEADAAAVTATVTLADGGVHFNGVTMLAVAVSFTEVTEVRSTRPGSAHEGPRPACPTPS